MTEIKTKKKEGKAARLKNRMKAIKPSLMLLGGFKTVANIVVKNYPEYKTVEGIDDIRKVYSFQQSDSKLTEIFESISSGKLK